MDPAAVFAALSYIGLFVFAVSGALTALRNDMDIFGVAMIGFVTGVGGGTIRRCVRCEARAKRGFRSRHQLPVYSPYGSKNHFDGRIPLVAMSRQLGAELKTVGGPRPESRLTIG